MEKIAKFVDFLTNFNHMERLILIKGRDMSENNAEHSFQLAMVAWYLIDSRGLKLDLQKVLRYALAHDLVEIYAGDVIFFRTKEESKKKEEEEAKAYKRIMKEFPDSKDLHASIEEYEGLVNEEAKFVYALDKLLPAMNIFLDGGRGWKKSKISLEMVKTKREKIAESPEVLEIWEELEATLEEKESSLFGPKTK